MLSMPGPCALISRRASQPQRTVSQLRFSLCPRRLLTEAQGGCGKVDQLSPEHGVKEGLEPWTL